MCGICCVLNFSPSKLFETGVAENLKRRGPNSSWEIKKTVTHLSYECLFSAHVLHMRGHLTPQPLEDANGNVFLWNGEVFGGLDVGCQENDTRCLFQHLSTQDSPEHVLSVMSCIRGPWAFIYYQAAKHWLWFGRDFFGRRSLLWRCGAEKKSLALTSVATYLPGTDHPQWQELPALGVYRLDLEACFHLDFLKLELYPWLHPGDAPPLINQFSEENLSSCMSVVMNGSGLCLTTPVCPLNKTIARTVQETAHTFGSQPSVEDLDLLLKCDHKKKLANRFLDVLSNAVQKRVQCLPCDIPSLQPHKEEADIAILFSGGIDSMILAALADSHVPLGKPIDLLNVAFKLQDPKRQKESKKMHKKKTGSINSCPEESLELSRFDVPDRITGRAGLQELKVLNPERKWNFVEINVTQEELHDMRQKHICHLVHPLDTVLDDSIGCAVWFAARGVGLVQDGTERSPFTSPAKVVLTGIGADEQLAGYSRHRVRYRTSGIEGLVQELVTVMQRTRCCSRFPYLDEEVVSFLNSIPVWEKAEFSLPRGLGEKLLLRLAARELGLGPSAMLPKRAMQFGSRIAKLENHQEKASDKCSRLYMA
ncbi:asparagine synthetase domain-containing protein 1-like [Scleropages formosus]|uniref:Asparagine synthetase domain-containing protein 1 n=1 Tax=Scleropages formosus TaxID=113540 RepID=A0A0P7TJS9_SCLFO|nr:asparagine synthetase domain-containing protein 1-like [Scleropages formosus]